MELEIPVIKNVEAPLLPGVLRLACARSHGRDARGRSLFVLQPRDTAAPALLAPCGPARTAFIKCRADRYVLFRTTALHAEIVETLGEVSAPGAFRAYELASRGLRAVNAPLATALRAALPPASKETSRESLVTAMLATRGLDDRRADSNFHAITIDAPGAVIFDDALSASVLPGGGTEIRLYVADVRAWCTALNLWSTLGVPASARTRTIYLPGARMPMLPPALEALASLSQGESRFAVMFELRLDATGAQMPESLQSPARAVAICVSRNFAFDDPTLPSNTDYALLLATAHRRDPEVTNARDMVAHWMCALNMRAAQLLAAAGTGIFRVDASAPANQKSAIPYFDSGLSSAEKACARAWHEGVVGKYSASAPEHTPTSPLYAHASSPIRRMGDLVNQTILIPPITHEGNTCLAAAAFVKHWLERAPFLGEQARAAAAAERACLLESTAECADANDTTSVTLRGFWLTPRDPDGRRWAHIPALGAAFRTHRTGDPIAPEYNSEPRSTFHLIWFPGESGSGRRVRVIQI